ncbi:MAG: Coenzyme F420 hydrogenase/dehydrogenase, beta subunit C-terminal domain, partial [Synergistales bacterium]|nr:Coenzyme F420 hydrogenase/dehydrogenase, beta subunit C-terminal domain [Synergistales bacterium]
MFSQYCNHRNDHLGWWYSTYVGYVRDDRVRARASSGGIGRWLLAALLSRNLVDACIHVRARTDQTAPGPLFSYAVSRTADEVMSSARSAYYPVEMSNVLKHVLEVDGRYVITGVPCFIKAIRLLQKRESLFARRIVFAIGLFCGHLKSSFYAEMLAWQLGISPSELRWIDFRDKSVSRTAKDKGVVASSCNLEGRKGPRVARELFGADYDLGFFQYPACDYCDDVAAETADVVVGDAWLPEYIPDRKGTSLVVVRHREIDRLLQDGVHRGELQLSPIDPARIVESQAGAFRHRHEGLAFRLYLDERAGRWHPRKRVAAGCRHISPLRRRIYRTRIQMREASFHAFRLARELGDFEV